MLTQNVNDLLPELVGHVRVLANVEHNHAGQLGSGVDSSHGKCELRSTVVYAAVESPSPRELVQPAEGIGRLGGLLAGGQRPIHSGLAALDLGADDGARVLDGPAGAPRMRQKPVDGGVQEGGAARIVMVVITESIAYVLAMSSHRRFRHRSLPMKTRDERRVTTSAISSLILNVRHSGSSPIMSRSELRVSSTRSLVIRPSDCVSLTRTTSAM